MRIEIPILAHTEFDLSKLDFTFKDILLYDIESVDFEEYIRSLNPDEFVNNFNFVVVIKSEKHFESQKYYAIVKKDYQQNYNKLDIYNVYTLLLILFPSDLQILYELHYDEVNGKIQSGGMSSWNKRTTGEYPGEYMLLSDDYLDEVNEFIRIAFDRINNKSFLGLAISHYLTSFEASHYHYQYVALCMVLETVISGKSELTYRLKRNIALLLGNSNYAANNIYNNLGKVYDLRSNIVHGEEYNHEKIITYMPYLRALASRTLIELLVHNYEKNKDLNHKITELGFGDRSKISDKYKEFKLNIETYVIIKKKDL